MPQLLNQPTEKTTGHGYVSDAFIQESSPSSLPTENEITSSQAFSETSPSVSARSRPIYFRISSTCSPWVFDRTWFFTKTDILIVLILVGVIVGGVAGFAAFTEKPFALAPTLWGTVLLLLIAHLRMSHQKNFTGKRPQSWLISWLFRWVMFYAFFCVLDAMLQKPWQGLGGVIASTLPATGSIVWQYINKKKSNETN